MKHSVRSVFVQKAGAPQPSGNILRFLPFDPAEVFQHYSHVSYCAQTCEPPSVILYSPEFVCRRPLADPTDLKNFRTWEWDRRLQAR